MYRNETQINGVTRKIIGYYEKSSIQSFKLENESRL